MGITGGDEGYSSPLAMADDSGSSKEDEMRPVSCDPCKNASPAPATYALISTSFRTSIFDPSESS
jgi:hypothetical protein